MTTSADIRFQYYSANIKDSSPLGFVTLDEFFMAIQNPKPHIRETFNKIRQAELDGNGTLKAELKAKLYSFTPAVIIESNRKYENIKSFTGLMPLDFDHLDPQMAVELKYELKNSFPFIIATWLSASKCGVRALVNIPICSNVEEYKAYFNGIQHLSDIGKIINFDTAPKNAVLPLFLSHDPDILFGDCHSIWETKYHLKQLPKIVQYKYDANPTKVHQLVKKSIDKITSNGHPQLRAAAFALGGYVGAGYIGQEEASSYICNLIESNAYLSQKPEVYKKTADEMISKGSTKPLYL
jgi:hypothetical protein